MEKITKFLNENKVYIEIVLTVFVIVLTFNANRIAKQQKLISQKEKEPIFYIKVERSPLGTNINNLERSLLFYNLAGDYENFEEKTISEYIIEFPDSLKTVTRKRVFITGFFNAEFTGDLKQGQIRTLYGFKNESKLSRLDSLLNVVKEKLKLDYCFAEFHNYTKISYLNFLGEKVVKYYEVSFREGILLNSEDGEKIFERYFEDFSNGRFIELDSLNEDNLINVIKE